MMKRILLNTALAAVLYLSNTVYASVDNRNDLLVDQDDVSKSLFHLPGKCSYRLSEEINLHILGFLPLKDLARFSQVSRDCQRLASEPILDKMSEYANPNAERPLGPQFTHLLESIRTGRGKFTIYDRFPSAYYADANPDESDSKLKFQVHSIKDDGRFILKKDIKTKEVYIKSRQSDDYYHIFPNTTDNNTYVGSIEDLKGKVAVCTVEVEPLVNIDLSVPPAYIQDSDMNQIPATIKSFKHLLISVPQDIVETHVTGISSDKQALFEICHDIKNNVQGFIWTRENDMQKLKIITRLLEEHSKPSIAYSNYTTDEDKIKEGCYTNCTTDKGEITGGSSLFLNGESIACIWTGKQNAVFSLQKLIQLGPNPIPKNISLSDIISISPSGKAMLGQGYLLQEDAVKKFWWTYVLSSDDDSNLNNNTLTLSIN